MDSIMSWLMGFRCMVNRNEWINNIEWRNAIGARGCGVFATVFVSKIFFQFFIFYFYFRFSFLNFGFLFLRL